MIGLYHKRIKVRKVDNGYLVYFETKEYDLDDYEAKPGVNSKELYFPTVDEATKFLDENR